MGTPLHGPFSSTPSGRIGHTPEPAWSAAAPEKRRTPEPRIFSTPTPTPDPDRFTPEYVLERVCPGFVREPSTVARLRRRFSAFYGEKEPPPPRPQDVLAVELEEAKLRAAFERVPVRRERVGVSNVADCEGSGKNGMCRWVERVDPGNLPASGLASVVVPQVPGSPNAKFQKPTTVCRESHRRDEPAGGPIREEAPLIRCEYRTLKEDLPWGVNTQLTERFGRRKNQNPLSVGLVLRRFGGERFLPCAWKSGGAGGTMSKIDTQGSGSTTNTARMRRSQFKEFTDMNQASTTFSSRYEPGYRSPRKPSTRTDNQDMRPAGFRTTDRYIF